MKQILIAAFMLAAADAAQLRITVYDRARLPIELKSSAYDNLRRIFHRSGIDIQLVAGDPYAGEASLMIYPSRLRKGLEQEAACLARRDIALEIVALSPRGLKHTVLGMSQPLSREGINVRVFDDRVRDAASRQGRTHAVVLSHAIAHEIGHVLLRSNTHSNRGLMAEFWTESEYQWMTSALLSFSGGQSRQMRRNLSGSGCMTANTVQERSVP